MVFTKEDFKQKWEANENGSGITFDDIADCAVAWGISPRPRTRPIDHIRYMVLKAANVCDAEEYNPNPAPQCEERTMIDLDKAVKWLTAYFVDYLNFDEQIIKDFERAMKGGYV